MYNFSKNIVPQYNTNSCSNCENLKNQYEAKFEQLIDSVNKMTNAVETLTATTTQQNSVIMEALATQKIITEKLLGKEQNDMNIKKDFPVKTINDLAKIKYLSFYYCNLASMRAVVTNSDI